MKLLQRIEALERAVALAGPRPSVEAQGHLRTLLRALTEALLWSTPSEALGQRAVRAAVSARIALGELPQPSLRQVDLEPRRRSADDLPSQSPEVLAIEAEKLLRSLPSKGRLLTRKDIAGFIQVGRALLSLEEQSQISYVALGRSPAVLVAFLRRALGMKIVDLPLGGLSELTGLGLQPGLPPARLLRIACARSPCPVDSSPWIAPSRLRGSWFWLSLRLPSSRVTRTSMPTMWPSWLAR